MRRPLKTLLTPPLMLLAALLMLIEEVLWESLKRVMAAFGSLPVMRSIEAWISRLPPYGAAAAFLFPGAMLLPIKIAAVWLIAHHHAMLGCQVILAAKLVGTALVARIFTLTKPQLMTLAWFVTLYNFVMRCRAVLYGWVTASGAWQRVMAIRAKIRAVFARMRPGRLVTRLRAIQRYRRRAAFR
ncbi:MAG TPA: hypothetical protein VGN52_09355 [Burkholderiales bacterium]